MANKLAQPVKFDMLTMLKLQNTIKLKLFQFVVPFSPTL